MSKVDLFMLTDTFKDLQQQVRDIMPMRIKVFEKYWKRYKWNKEKREHIMAMFDASDV